MVTSEQILEFKYQSDHIDLFDKIGLFTCGTTTPFLVYAEPGAVERNHPENDVQHRPVRPLHIGATDTPYRSDGATSLSYCELASTHADG